MPLDVITTDQLKYHRLVASKDNKSRDRWVRNFSWYPGRQNIESSRIAEIYCESQDIYGAEIFEQYAKRHRLNKKHAYSDAETLQMSKKQEDFGEDINYAAKVPPTENGEYGRFRPNRMHYC